ncbi:hypothetical protein Q7C18_01320 [Nesterenkonia sp. CL21]|uniref:hypothetical protein n=1 Tax=Nesterenkonia sp. CL21 TaxID=3064894 RepID=UPI00287830AC|nr:hypothetical protein [Nesterenkonia sp. CL21]MDS2171336.1 hypothetical protein [Nesterenkonia sp. CL21]
MTTHRAAPAALVALLALTGCGSGDSPTVSEAPSETPETSEAPEPTDQPEPEEDPDLPSEDQLQEFVDAIAASTPSALRDAADLVMPDSPAADYLTYYTHNIEASIDAGLTEDGGESSDIEDGYEACATYDGETSCTAYTESTGRDGQIYSFLVEGREIEDRLIVGSGESVETLGGSTVEFIAAYLNANDTHLLVAYELHTGDARLQMPLTSYRGPSGRQSQSDGDWGARSLSPDSMSHYVASFPSAELGGELHLELVDEDGWDMETVVLPTSG